MPLIFKNKKISFIIVSYRSQHFLADCIQAILQNTTGEYEIILVENHSGENIDSIRDLSPQKIQVIYADSNAGFGSGVNLGATKATGDWLCILNPDTRIQKNIHTLSTQDQNPGIIGLALVNQQQQLQNYQYGNFPTPFSILNHSSKKTWQIPSQKALLTDWVSGGSLCIQTKLFRQLAGFDTSFFMYYEDIDLCYRVKQLGYRVEWNPAITIWHYEGGSEKNRVKTKQRYYRGQRKYIAKWYGWYWNLLLYPLHQFLVWKMQ